MSDVFIAYWNNDINELRFHDFRITVKTSAKAIVKDLGTSSLLNKNYCALVQNI